MATFKKAQAPIALKSLDAATGEFSGYASTFGNKDLGGDIVLPGAFTASLASKAPGDIRVLWQHSMSNPIGITSVAREDDVGLYVEGNLILDVQQAREAQALAKNGALGGLSIGYCVDDYDYSSQGDCLLKALDVMEYSFVTFPMNPKAEILSMKNAQIESVRDCEAFLRDACGLSRSDAKMLISRIRGAKADVVDVSEMLAEASDADVLRLKNALNNLTRTASGSK